MYSRLAHLYSEGRITKEYLDKAVILGWITEAEEEQILNQNESNEE